LASAHPIQEELKMPLDDIKISRAILRRWAEKFDANMDVDVAIAGAGPAGLAAAYYLAKAGKRVAIFERKLSLGGGMWGGGMLFNEIVVSGEGKAILDEFGVRTEPFEEEYFTADSVEAVTKMAAKAMDAGAKIFNTMSVEDTLLMDGKVEGFVINWSAVEIANLHVDPLTIRCKAAIEATGHPLEVLRVLARKSGLKLDTPSGGIEGERPMHAEVGEKKTIENTKEIFPGLWVAGMAANAAYGAPRMGPIFGGMLASGKKCAGQILAAL